MKLRKLFFSILLFFILLPSLSLAEVCTPDGGTANSQGLCNPLALTNSSSLQDFGIHILQVFSTSAGILTIIYVMFSGFRFIISQGNSEDIETAKRSLQWSLSGLVVMLLSYVLVSSIFAFFN